MAASFAKQPLRFETNVGQAREDVRFIAQGGGVRLTVEDTKATLRVRHGSKKHPAPATELTLSVPGARNVKPVASEELATKVNYLVGDRSAWRTNIATYSKVTYPSVLDGVDLVYHGEGGKLEYDFVVAPGADVAKVALDVAGTDRLSLNERGDLVIETSTGTVVQQRPYVFQRDAKGAAHEVRAAFRVQGKSRVGFEVASYDHSQPLVIDPIFVSYATYLGNSSGNDWINGVAADATGAAYVVGTSEADAAPPGYDAPKYKSLVPPAPVFTSLNQQVPTKFFVARLNASGQLDYITYGGGDGSDDGNAIAVDANGNSYITGATTSDNLPVTDQTPRNNFQSAFVAQLTADGSAYRGLQYVDLGPADGGGDEGYGIAVVGNTVVVGGTASFHFPASAPASVKPNACVACARSGCAADEVCTCACEKPLNGAFAVGVPVGGGGQIWTRVYGGGDQAAVTSVATDAASNVYIAGYTDQDLTAVPVSGGYLSTYGSGHHSFVAKIAIDSVNGGAPSYGTYFNTGNSQTDEAHAVVGGTAGQVYVTGTVAESFCSFDCPPPFPTKSSGLSTRSSGEDTYVVHINTNLSGADGLTYSAILAGNGTDSGQGIALDGLNQAYVTGWTSSSNYPTIPSHLATDSQDADMFLSVVSNDGNSLVASVTLHGDFTDQANAIAIRGTNVFIAGLTDSSGMSTAPAGAPSGVPVQADIAGGEGQDGFVAKFSIAPLAINPTAKTVGTGEAVQFTATGGAGGPYVFTVNPNNSGATIDSNGLYHSGTNGGVSDTVVAQDAQNNTVTAVVSVTMNGGNPTFPTDLALAPVSASTAPRGTIQFTATGGTSPYIWSVSSNSSGGSVGPNGLYTAGSTGLVSDSVRVVDANGVTRTVAIAVGPAITITPPQASVAQQGTQQFLASGGTGGPYTWTATAGTVSGTGLFTAPASVVVATITATDSLGNKASVNASIGGALAISPVNPSTYPNGVVHLDVFGGSGAGYAWTIISDPNDPTTPSTINGTGGFTAGPKGNIDVQVDVHDSNLNHAIVVIHVGPGLTIDPTHETRQAGQQVAFAAVGGSGEQYTYTLAPNNSNGSIAQDGLYTAGPNAGTDTIVLTDSVGNKATATVDVTEAPKPPPTNPTSTGTGTPPPPPTANPVSVGNGQINTTPVGGGDGGCAVVSGNTSKPPVSLGVGVLLGLSLLVRRRRRVS